MTPELARDWAPRELGCETGIESAQLDMEFFLPEPSDGRPPAFSKAELSEAFGFDYTLELFGSFADPSNRILPIPREGIPTHMFIQDGEDVIVRTYSGLKWHRFPLEEHEFRGLVTAMVDYELVEAEFTHWDSEREEALSHATGYAMTFAPDDELAIVDIRVPAEAFPPGTSELSTFVHALPPNTISRAGRNRYKVHKRAITKQSEPCFSKPWGEPFNEVELGISKYQDHMNAFMMLMPENMLNLEALYRIGKPIAVSPNETLEIYATARRSGTSSEQPTSRAFMLFMEEEPLWQEPVFIATTDQNEGSSYADWRGVFEVTLPEEPGTHTKFG